jgi:hypothetical protein
MHSTRHGGFGPVTLSALSTLFTLAALVSFTLSACASPGGPTLRRAPLDPTRTLTARSRMLDDQTLRTLPQRTALEAVAAYWPNLRSVVGMPSLASRRELDQVGVYSNEMFAGGLDYLRDVPTAHIARIVRLTPTEELIRFGRQHMGGALVIEWAPLR